MKNAKEMTYRELEKEVIENRKVLVKTTDLNLKRNIIARDHDLMQEMDRRWNTGEMKTKVIK